MTRRTVEDIEPGHYDRAPRANAVPFIAGKEPPPIDKRPQCYRGAWPVK